MSGVATRTRFAALLIRHRLARRWSQDRLADEAAMDHSLVSRLESGQRNPTREAIGKLALGLGLTDTEWDELQMFAGFLPHRPEATIADEAEVLAFYRLIKGSTPFRQAAIRNGLAAIHAMLLRDGGRSEC